MLEYEDLEPRGSEQRRSQSVGCNIHSSLTSTGPVVATIGRGLLSGEQVLNPTMNSLVVFIQILPAKLDIWNRSTIRVYSVRATLKNIFHLRQPIIKYFIHQSNV